MKIWSVSRCHPCRCAKGSGVSTEMWRPASEALMQKQKITPTLMFVSKWGSGLSDEQRHQGNWPIMLLKSSIMLRFRNPICLCNQISEFWLSPSPPRLSHLTSTTSRGLGGCQHRCYGYSRKWHVRKHGVPSSKLCCTYTWWFTTSFLHDSANKWESLWSGRRWPLTGLRCLRRCVVNSSISCGHLRFMASCNWAWITAQPTVMAKERSWASRAIIQPI